MVLSWAEQESQRKGASKDRLEQPHEKTHRHCRDRRAPASQRSPTRARRPPRADRRSVVPMDGFHLAQVELERRGLSHKKGAPETFDLDGFAALLHRLRVADASVMCPAFRREIEEPIAGSIAVEPDHAVVLVEGNYLLHDQDGWEQVLPLLDECWYVDLERGRCAGSRLRARAHMFATVVRRPRQTTWMESVDEPNARTCFA